MSKNGTSTIKKSLERLTSELKATKKLSTQLEKLLLAYSRQHAELVTCITTSEELLDDRLPTDSLLALSSATKQMQETQMSFNLQYLQLQSQMQHENRSYTAISNIMKTKHDTVKNSISNIR